MRIQAAAFTTVLMLAPIPRCALAGSPGPGDRMSFVGSGPFFEAFLPRGPAELTMTLQQNADGLAFAADGRLYAVQNPADTPPVPVRLFEIDDNGLNLIGELALEPGEEVLDMAFGPGDRLYLLTYWLRFFNPPEVVTRLVEIDPSTAAILGSSEFPADLTAVASAPRGLWALRTNELVLLDPDSGALWETGIEATRNDLLTLSATTDSSGALWLLTTTLLISPPSQFLIRLDPVTGSRRLASFAIPQNVSNVAVLRQCKPTATARCLQGGRFRVEVVWEDFIGRTGPGRVAPSGSVDSALFWFFDPANWEVLVKVLDGCDSNDHFWVFAAATTNVAYTLQVTDLETGRTHTVENALGQAMTAATDTMAFACR